MSPVTRIWSGIYTAEFGYCDPSAADPSGPKTPAYTALAGLVMPGLESVGCIEVNQSGDDLCLRRRRFDRDVICKEPSRNSELNTTSLTTARRDSDVMRRG